MKKLFSYLMVMATLLIGGGKAMAQSVTIGGVTYSISSDYATVTGFDGSVIDVVIQNTISFNGTDYPVTVIGSNAFMYCSSIVSLVLPENLTTISSCAFYDCVSLKELRIPSKVTTIGWNALVGLKSVTLIELQFEDITSNMEILFSDMAGRHIDLICHSKTVPQLLCTANYSPNSHGGGGYVPTTTTLYVPKECYDQYRQMYSAHTIMGLSDIGEETFIEDGIRYIGTEAIEVLDKTLTEYTIKEGTTSLGLNLFSGCTNMTSISIPGSVISIGQDAFSGCTSLPVENGIRYADCCAVEVVDKSLTEYSLKDNMRFLGSRLFADCKNLTSVDIPSSVIEVGNYAFSNCTTLDSITLPEGLISLGAHAFYNCKALTSINIPAGVTSINYGTFEGCQSLASVTLPDGLKEIGTWAFISCKSLTSVILPEGLTYLGTSAFQSCSNLTSISIPSGVSVIYNQTFDGCYALTDVILPNGLTQILNLAFNNCTALTTINTPNTVTYIADNAFAGCNSLPTETGIRYVGTYMYELINSSLSEYTIKDGVETIPANFFSGCTNMTKVTIPNSVTSIGNDAFAGCTSLPIEDGIRYADCYAIVITDKTLEEYKLKDNVRFLGNELFKDCSAMAMVTIPSGVTNIGNNTFYGCSALTSLTLPESVTSIGARAFYNCSSLTSVNIPDGVASIGDNTFSDCSSLTSLTLPESVTSIGTQAFYNCSSLTSVNIPDGVASIGDNTFSGCSSLASLTLPESVTSIGTQAFFNCSSLTSVNIPDGVASIGDYTFSDCSSLTSLTLPDSVTSIGTQAFYNCSSLTSVNIPEGVSVIEEYTFGNCASLDSLTIPASVTSIGNYAFQGCTGLKELTLADGGKTLSLGINGNNGNGGLFTSCKLEKLYLGRNLSYNTDGYYGYSPFNNQTALKEVVVGDSVTAIGANAFYICSALTSITIPSSVTSIGANAFYGCGTLTYVYSDIESPAVLASSSLRNQAVIYVPEGTYVPYKELFPNNIIVDGAAQEVTVHVAIPGTLGEEVLNQIPYIRNVNSLKVSGTLNNDDISTITGSMVNLLHLDLSKVNATSVNGIGHANLCSIVFPDSCKSISGYNERDNLTSVTLPDAVETLGNNCFEYCDQLAEVTMSANLKTIGNYAFYYCGKLKEVTFKDGDKSIGIYAFYDCDNLTSVSFGAGVASIGQYAFNSCVNLTSVSFGAGVASIERYAFASCGRLRTLVLGDRISVNNLYSFQGCGNLSEIHIPSIEAWLNSTFSDNSYSCPNRVSSKTNLYIDGELVTDVVIPSSVTSIRPYAFSRMSGITSVTIPDGVTTISQEAFYDCNGLASVTMADGVKTIGANAFAGCDSLKTITLPSTLSNCAAGAFSGSGLTEVTCPAFFPPVTGGDVIGANNCTLYVPEWTLNRYKLANNWNLFAAIEPISGIYPSTISVYTEEGLTIPAEGLAEGYIPNLELVRYDASNVGRLTLRGEKAMPLATFTMEQTRDAGTMTSLVNYGTLTADSVATELTISANTWHYLSFPYDVKIADIATLGDWVIRRYDGASRARADFSSTWQNVPYDSILHAGEGYIWYSTNGNFTVPAIENDNRNLIFANDTRYTQLKEHASATVANYGWNLIGNPYPCFYDTRFMEFSSPITVRSGNSYAAYSPLDDSYILSPLEAFFVQCSADNNVVGFTAEGRQTDNTVRALTSAPQRARAANSERKVFNLYLESDSYADHTRFVINEKASLAYEISCDAAKFMSDDPAVQQLFTIEGGEHMAINERPLANGEVMLGAYFGKGGSYTFALDTRATEMEVVLIDRYTGAETDLLTSSYMFTTEAGMFTDRFAIGMKRTGDVTAIETPAAKLEVVAVEGAISIRNAAAPVHIYNAAGALVATEHGQEVTVEAAPGIYVVKVGNAAHKVSVIK